MRFVRLFSVLVVLASSAVCFAGDDFLPVTAQDLAFKEVPGNPGASAVILFYRHDIDDNTYSEFIYYRIKVLNAKGKEYADVQVPVLNVRVDLTDLKARTIRPDGSIVPFTGKVFEKTAFKGRGIKFAEKAFTMPEVSEGCILEYKFRLAYRRKTFPPTSDLWVLQHDLYTVKEVFSFNPYSGENFQSASSVQYTWNGATVSAISTNLNEKPKSQGAMYELERQNIPAFESEGYMPPENNFLPLVHFVYIPKGNPATDRVWRELGKDFYESGENFMAQNAGVKEATVQAIGNETDPEKKLRKLYARVQQIRNLSFEPNLSDDDERAEGIKRLSGVGDVLKRGYGHEDGISLLFIAMARAAGFDAVELRASDRKEMFFSKELLTLGRRETVLVSVNLGGKDLILDPGGRFSSFGQVRWPFTSTDALRLDKKGGAFIKVPPETYDKSATQRVANVSIAENGSLKGEVAVQFTGQDALERRLDAIDRDDAGKKKALEDEMKSWLPAEAVVKLISSEGWQTPETPVTARFSVEIPSYASVSGKHLLVPTYLFQVKQADAFKHSERKYPVYFPYPFTEVDQITTNLPAGYTLVNLPQKQEARLPYAKYQNISRIQGSQLVTQRSLLFNGVFVELNRYPELRTFFNTVQTGDEQPAVLQTGGNTSAGQSN